jgi:hypothetical protein
MSLQLMARTRTGRNGKKCALVWLGRIRLEGWSGIACGIAAGFGHEDDSEVAGSIAGFGAGILSGLRARRAGLIRHSVQVKTALLKQAA